MKPRDAEVYVDGYYAGVVDDFDGIFQRLHLDSGPHRIEVRAPGYEPLVFDVRITPDHTTTYQGEMKRIPVTLTALRTIAAVSGIYDALVGVTMLLGRPLLAQLFDVPLPNPPIHADLNGIFLLAVAAGYLIPYREPRLGRRTRVPVDHGTAAERRRRGGVRARPLHARLAGVVSAVCRERRRARADHAVGADWQRRNASDRF